MIPAPTSSEFAGSLTPGNESRGYSRLPGPGE
jgi:hypothetical protein